MKEYSITEAAVILGCTTKTVSRRIKSGKLQTVISDGKKRVLLPDTTGQRDRTGNVTNDRTFKDIETVEVLRTERDQARAERDRERGEVEFLRQRNAELNSIIMRHALSLPPPKQIIELETTGQNNTTATRQNTTGQVVENVRSQVPSRPDTMRKRPAKRRLPLWARFFGFR